MKGVAQGIRFLTMGATVSRRFLRGVKYSGWRATATAVVGMKFFQLGTTSLPSMESHGLDFSLREDRGHFILDDNPYFNLIFC